MTEEKDVEVTLPGTKKVSLRLSVDELTEYRTEADRRGVSLSDVLRDLVTIGAGKAGLSAVPEEEFKEAVTDYVYHPERGLEAAAIPAVGRECKYCKKTGQPSSWLEPDEIGNTVVNRMNEVVQHWHSKRS